MDANALEAILKEEKRRLNIFLRHKLKPFGTAIKIEGTAFLQTDDVFQVMVVFGRMELIYHQEKITALTKDECRLMIRHELCHVLDNLEKKIGHSFPGFIPGDQHIPETELMNAIISETVRAYYEFSMAKRYVTLFGIDEFNTQNEIGMDEFLTLTQELILGLRSHHNQLAAYVLFSVVFGVLKEAVKVNFYRPQDPRFPSGLWRIVDWLCEDFDYLDALKISWKDKSSLLCFEALTIFENFDVVSALELDVARCQDQLTSRAYTKIGKMSPVTQTLLDRWLQRFNALKK